MISHNRVIPPALTLTLTLTIPPALLSKTFKVPSKLVFFHDFIVTEKFYVFNEAPLELDPLPFILGLKGPAECIKVCP